MHKLLLANGLRASPCCLLRLVALGRLTERSSIGQRRFAPDFAMAGQRSPLPSGRWTFPKWDKPPCRRSGSCGIVLTHTLQFRRSFDSQRPTPHDFCFEGNDSAFHAPHLGCGDGARVYNSCNGDVSPAKRAGIPTHPNLIDLVHASVASRYFSSRFHRRARHESDLALLVENVR